jgi:hypothetical protein
MAILDFKCQNDFILDNTRMYTILTLRITEISDIPCIYISAFRFT